MRVVKSLQKALEEGNYDRVKDIMGGMMNGLGYELVKKHDPYIIKAIRMFNHHHLSSRDEIYIDAHNCRCSHFTNPNSENLEGIVYSLSLGKVYYPHSVEIEKLGIVGYGGKWKSDTWWRKRKTIFPCMEKKLFIPEGVKPFYTVLPEEIVEKLKK